LPKLSVATSSALTNPAETVINWPEDNASTPKILEPAARVMTEVDDVPLTADGPHDKIDKALPDEHLNQALTVKGEFFVGNACNKSLPFEGFNEIKSFPDGKNKELPLLLNGSMLCAIPDPLTEKADTPSEIEPDR